jgi:hypothetical protein
MAADGVRREAYDWRRVAGEVTEFTQLGSLYPTQCWSGYGCTR